MSKRLYVGNLSYNTTNESLKAAFEQIGAVEEASIVMDRMTGRSRGFGFVVMGDDDASKAIEQLHNKDLDGRALIVNEARPKAERAPRSGGGNRY